MLTIFLILRSSTSVTGFKVWSNGVFSHYNSEKISFLTLFDTFGDSKLLWRVAVSNYFGASVYDEGADSIWDRLITLTPWFTARGTGALPAGKTLILPMVYLFLLGYGSDICDLSVMLLDCFPIFSASLAGYELPFFMLSWGFLKKPSAVIWSFSGNSFVLLATLKGLTYYLSPTLNSAIMCCPSGVLNASLFRTMCALWG